MRLGSVSGEGGPFLIVDRLFAEQWRGTDGDGADYEQVYGISDPGGVLRVGDGFGVAWHPGGGATADFHNLGDGHYLLQRPWIEDAGTPPVAPGATPVGSAEVASGTLVILWSALGWADVFMPPAVGEAAELAGSGMLGIGLQVPVKPATYACFSEYSDEAYRCWLVEA